MAKLGHRFDDLGSDGAPARLGIMGGTFDPIHIGHLRIAEEVREVLALDGVLFVPTGNPVFKKDQRLTDAHVRFERVRQAVAGNPHFDVSSVEVDRAGDTFTVDTLRELRACYPGNVAFYFIVGSDAAATIGKWRSVSEIAELAHLAVAAGRPDSATADELRAAIMSAAPFEFDIVQVSSLEISSSDIRDRIAHGKSVRYLVPEGVRVDFGEGGVSSECQLGPGGRTGVRPYEGGQELHCVTEPPLSRAEQSGFEGSPRSDQPEAALTKEFYEARKAELVNRVSPKRFEHIMGVAKTAKKLAKRYGVDPRKARLAGLLHDWDKGLDDDQARVRVHELGLEDALSPWVVENMPRVLHGHTAAAALGRDFPEIPRDVLQAIDRHTTAAEDMSDLDKILYIADALEPNRKFGRIDELREAAKTSTLDELYFQTYEYWTLLLFERRQPLHPDTMRIWNANALRWQAEKEKRKK